jgi:hypothetical protein
MRKRARTALCGGRSVMTVPTATLETIFLPSNLRQPYPPALDMSRSMILSWSSAVPFHLQIFTFLNQS